ncbi:MAG: DUF87 domain-containing protein [Deltaproteobacteria bacterium]|jgi:hypothetical protein
MIIDVTSLLLWLGALVRRVVSLLSGCRLTAGASSPLAVLGAASDGRVVTWPAPSAERACSAVVLGSSGAGKSVLIASMIAQQIELERTAPARKRTANVICDPKGDLAKLVVAGVAALAPDRLVDDLTILAPFERPIPLNVCLAASPHGASVRALSLAELVSGTSAALGDHRVVAMGPKQVSLLADVLEGCITARHPARSALWAIDALTVDGGVEMLGALTTSPRARRALGARINRDLADSCAARLRAAFSLTEGLEAMVGASSCMDIDALTRAGAITIIDLSGSPPALRAVWSSILLRAVMDAALARPSPFDGHHLRISQDECHLTAPVLSASVEELSTTGRSRSVSLACLSQGTVLLDRASPALVDVLLTNSPTQIIGRVGAPDAKLLSRFVSPSPGVSESVGAVQSVFAATVANLADRTFIEMTPGGRTRFRSADVDLAAWTEAADRHASAIERAKTRWVLDDTGGERVTLEQAATEGLRSSRRPAARKRNPTGAKKINAPTTPTTGASEKASMPASTRWG